MSEVNPIVINEITGISGIKIIKESGSLAERNFSVKFKTILQTFEEPNRNKRIYSLDAGKSIYEQAQKLIEESNFVGELDHPVSENVQRESTVEYKTCSHKFTKVELRDNVLYAEGITLTTSTGIDLACLMKDGVKPGFSLRAIGFNIKKAGENDIVYTPIMLVAYDCVKTPSHKAAVVQSISLTEAYSIVCEKGVCKIIDKKTKKEIKKEKILEILINRKLRELR